MSRLFADSIITIINGIIIIISGIVIAIITKRRTVADLKFKI